MYMRPDIDDVLLKKVESKWREENKIHIEIPITRIIEDVLLRYVGRTSDEIAQIQNERQIRKLLYGVKNRFRKKILE